MIKANKVNKVNMFSGEQTFEPEKEDGNIEYKLKLVDKSDERIEGLATQMKYRCEEGSSECIYNIGVNDDGTIVGITEAEYNETMRILKLAAEKNNYVLSLVTKTLVENDICGKTSDDKYVYEVLVREHNELGYIDIKVAVAGSVDVGKCLDPHTLIRLYNGGLIYAKNVQVGDRLLGDDHQPRKVLKLYDGVTEMYDVIQQKGIAYRVTSNHILGFDAGGNSVNYSGVNGKLTWPEIVSKSSKVVSFYDLCGHEKYLKTTISI